MSFDIGLICFENGDTAPLPAAIMIKAFAPNITPVDDGELWELSFPDGGGGEMDPLYDTDRHFDFCITGASGEDIYKPIFEIMRQTHTLLWWSGCDDAMVTADPDIAAHLPPDYIEQNGTPALVRSVDDIFDEIAKT
jgi:hypothetical protein